MAKTFIYKNKCSVCGKSLLYKIQMQAKQLNDPDWENTTIHYKCWRQEQDHKTMDELTDKLSNMSIKNMTSVFPPPLAQEFTRASLLPP